MEIYCVFTMCQSLSTHANTTLTLIPDLYYCSYPLASVRPALPSECWPSGPQQELCLRSAVSHGWNDRESEGTTPPTPQPPCGVITGEPPLTASRCCFEAELFEARVSESAHF